MEYVVTFIKFFIVGIFSIIYFPLNLLLMWVRPRFYKWREKDKVVFYILAIFFYPFYWITAGVTMLYEAVADHLH